MALSAKWYRLVLFAPAALPLFFVGGLMYPMLAPKTFLLRAFGIIAFALFAYLSLSGKPFFYERLYRPFAWLPGAFLAFAWLASLLGIDFYHSFWSTFERGDGLLSLTVCVGYFYLILLSADREFAQKLLRFVAWVGSFAGFYVFIQWIAVSLGVDLPFIAQANGRIGGTMGNAAFLSAYLGVTFFVTLAVLREYRGTAYAWLRAGALFQLLGIVLAATRGTLLALVGVGLLTLAFHAFWGEGQWRLRARQAGAGVIVLIALFVMLRGPLAQVPFEPVRRLASISLTDATVSSRLFLWSNLLPAAFERPVFGIGAEQVGYLFNRIYDPTKLVEQWFDRSHNAYLDQLIQFGIPGLGLYLALIVTALLNAWRLRQEHAEGSAERRYGTFLLLALLVYAGQNFFVFDTAVTLWLTLALMALLLALRNAGEARPLSSLRRISWLPAGAAVALLLLLVPVVIQPLRANRLAFLGYRYHVADVARANAAMEKGMALETYADLEYGYNAYFMYTEQQIVMLAGDELRAAYENAFSILSTAYRRYPYDARTAVYLAHVMDTAPEGVTADPEFERQVITRAIELSPKRSQAWYILANLSIGDARTLPPGPQKTELYRNAISTLEAYLAVVPGLSEPHFVLADLYLALGDRGRADSEAAQGKEAYVSDLGTARRAAVYYEKIGDWQNAALFLTEVVGLDPLADSWRYDLAKARYLIGDYAGAKEIVEYLQARNPALLETDPAFMEAMRSL